MYADLDFEALRNVEPLLPGRQVLLGSMMTGMDECVPPGPTGAGPMCDHAIPNAWMASVRGHPFWLFALQQIIKTAGDTNLSRHACSEPCFCTANASERAPVWGPCSCVAVTVR